MLKWDNNKWDELYLSYAVVAIIRTCSKEKGKEQTVSPNLQYQNPP